VKQELRYFQSTPNGVIPASEATPGDLEKTFRNAEIGRLKWHLVANKAFS
jgi:hypothetical protein